MTPNGDSGVVRFRRTIFKFYLYTALSGVSLYAPIQIHYLIEHGLSFSQAGTLDALYLGIVVFSEIPTGYLGDRLGRRDSLIVGSALVAIALIGIGLAEAFPAFVVLYVIWGVGWAFNSGAGDAWLYELLEERLDEREFARVRGRGHTAEALVGIVGALAGGYLASVDLALPFYVSAGLVVVGLGVLLTLPRTDRFHEDSDWADTVGPVAALRLVGTELWGDALRWVIGTYVLFVATTGLVFLYTQPISTAIGLSEVHLGWLYAGFAVVTGGLSFVAGDINDRINIDQWFAAVPVVVAVSFMAMFVEPLAAFPAFFIARAGRTVSRPLAHQYINDTIEPTGRATVLSAVSMLSGVAGVVVRVGGGWLGDATTPIVAMALTGGILLVGTTGIRVVGDPVAATSPSE